MSFLKSLIDLYKKDDRFIKNFLKKLLKKLL